MSNKMKKKNFLFSLLFMLLFAVGLTGCSERMIELQDDNRGFRTCGRFGCSWGTYWITQPPPPSNGYVVVDQLSAMAEIIFDHSFPPATLLDPNDVADFEQAAYADPYRPLYGTGELDGHNIHAQYWHYNQTYIVKNIRPTKNTQALMSGYHPGVGEAVAEASAVGCLDEMEVVGLILPGKFSHTPNMKMETVSFFEDVGGSIQAYHFGFNPNLDGLPLISAEIIISVNAADGLCQGIRMTDQDFYWIGGSSPVTNDVQTAEAYAQAELQMLYPGTTVNLEGSFGYYLPVDQFSNIVEPQLFTDWRLSVDDPGDGVGPVLDRAHHHAMGLQPWDTGHMYNIRGPNGLDLYAPPGEP